MVSKATVGIGADSLLKVTAGTGSLISMVSLNIIIGIITTSTCVIIVIIMIIRRYKVVTTCQLEIVCSVKIMVITKPFISEYPAFCVIILFDNFSNIAHLPCILFNFRISPWYFYELLVYHVVYDIACFCPSYSKQP